MEKHTFGQPADSSADALTTCLNDLRDLLLTLPSPSMCDTVRRTIAVLEATNQAYGEKSQEMFAALQERDQARAEQAESERAGMLYIAAIVSAKCMGLCELDAAELVYGSELILEIGEIKDGPKKDGISMRAYKPVEAVELEQLRLAHRTVRDKGTIIQ